MARPKKRSILVGTSSWTDPTLLKSGWYPKEAKTPETRLAYYSSQFPLVEVDSTYYALPSEKNAGLWVDRTPAHFTFDVKAFSLMTQHPARVAALPKDLRDAAGDKERVYPKDLPKPVIDEIWEMFRRALMPLHSAGKLGAVFFQFPEWFIPSRDNRAYLETLRARLPDYHIAVEFRRKTWMDPPDSAERTLEFLADQDLSFVCVDMPQGFVSSIPDITAVTSERLSVVRFHGRNTEAWKKKGISTAERFDYLYSGKQLREWSPRVNELAGQAREVHVLFNNCYGDKAVRNAKQFAGLLKE